MEIELGNSLIFPRGIPGSGTVQWDMTEIYSVESRKNEIAYVNKDTAPELMAAFNKSYCDILRKMTETSLEYVQAVKWANKRKAVVMLDIAPETLKAKSLTNGRSPGGSEDLRNAVLDLDEEYLKLKDNVELINAVYELLKGKAKGLEMAYITTRKIYESLGFFNGLGSGSGNLNTAIGELIASDT